MGCRVAVQSSSNRVTRLLGIDADPVNQGWLCDKGRFACDAVNSEDRLVEPLVRKEGELVPASWHEALETVADRLGQVADRSGAGSIAVVGGARLTNEGAYAWTKLAKGVLRTDSVDAQLGDGLPAEVVAALPRATVDEMASADTVLVLSGDLREEVPVLFLRLRSAVVDGSTSLVEVAPQESSLTGYAAAALRARPGEIIAVAEALVGRGDAPGSIDSEALAEARRLLAAERVVVLLGRPSLAEAGELVAEAAQAIARALPHARFLPALRRGNVHGAIDMGMAPGMLPGRVMLDDGRSWFEHAWGAVPAERGRDTTAIFASAAAGRGGSDGEGIGALVLLGSDPLHDFPDRDLAGTRARGRGLRRRRRLRSRRGDRARRRGAPGRRAPRASRHHDEPRRPDQPARAEGRSPRAGLAGLDDRGRARGPPRRRSRLRFGRGGLGRDRAPGALPPRDHRAVLDEPGAADGVVAPLVAQEVNLVRRPVAPLDPIAFPGVESVEWQGAAPRAGLAEAPDTVSLLSGEGSEGSEGSEGDGGPDRSAGSERSAGNEGAGEPRRPECVRAPVEVAVPVVPAGEKDSVRLVAARRLYDLGSSIRAVPALTALVPAARLRIHPEDLDALGVAVGDRVRARSARGVAVVETVADPALPRGVVATEFNVPFAADGDDLEHGAGDQTVADLIDATEPVTELRLETP